MHRYSSSNPKNDYARNLGTSNLQSDSNFGPTSHKGHPTPVKLSTRSGSGDGQIIPSSGSSNQSANRQTGRLFMVLMCIIVITIGTNLGYSFYRSELFQGIGIHHRHYYTVGGTFKQYDCNIKHQHEIYDSRNNLDLDKGIIHSPRVFIPMKPEADPFVAQSSCFSDCKAIKTDAGMCILEKDSLRNREFRCLPSFFIAGVMKGGTGALMNMLNKHPLLQSGKGIDGKNEMHFFGHEEASEQLDTGGTECAWYRYSKMFPISTNVKYTFDKSPDYIRNKEALIQIRTMLPSSKIIVILRNPVKRLISAFNHHCRHGRYVELLKPFKLIHVNRYRPKGVVMRIEELYTAIEEKSLFVCMDESKCEKKNRVTNRSQLNKFIQALRYPCKISDFEKYVKPRDEFLEAKVMCKDHEICQDLELSAARSEIEMGFYDEQLKTLFDIFPDHQVLIVFQDYLEKKSEIVLHAIEDFLGLKNGMVNSYLHKQDDMSDGMDLKGIWGGLSDSVARSRSQKLQDALKGDRKKWLEELYLPHIQSVENELKRWSNSVASLLEGEGESIYSVHVSIGNEDDDKKELNAKSFDVSHSSALSQSLPDGWWPKWYKARLKMQAAAKAAKDKKQKKAREAAEKQK